jgi:hypothetical protein
LPSLSVIITMLVHPLEISSFVIKSIEILD